MKKFGINVVEKEFPFGSMTVLVLGDRADVGFQSMIPYHAPIDSQFLSLSVSQKGNVKIVPSTNDSGWLAQISCKSSDNVKSKCYNSVFCYEEDKTKISVIQKGHGGYGATRDDGIFYEFLLVVPDETVLKVRKQGSDKQWFVFKNNAVLFLDDNEYIKYMEQNGEIVDVKEKLMDINKLSLATSFEGV